MSGPGFDADVDRIGTHATEFDGLTERAAAIAAALKEAVGSAPWGDDAVGRAFENRHRPSADETSGVLDALSGGLAEVGESFSSAARAYRSADEESARSITDAGPEE